MHAVLHWLSLGVVLLVVLAVGICVHELLHVVPLWLTDASYTVTVLPGEDAPSETDDASASTALTALRNALAGGLVRVEVTHVPPSTPEWVVRAAALLPLVLALPLLLVLAGVLSDPLAAGNRVATVALVAVTGCGLPSPADWAAARYGSALCRED